MWGHANRLRSFLRQRGVVDDEDRIGPAWSASSAWIASSSSSGASSQTPLANEMMQLIVIAGRQSRRHQLDARAIAWTDQPRHIKRAHPPAPLMTQPRQERRKPMIEISIPVRHAVGSANQRSRRSGEILSEPLICQSSASSAGSGPSGVALGGVAGAMELGNPNPGTFGVRDEIEEIAESN